MPQNGPKVHVFSSEKKLSAGFLLSQLLYSTTVMKVKRGAQKTLK